MLKIIDSWVVTETQDHLTTKQRWVVAQDDNGNLHHASDCVWDGKFYTAEQFLERHSL